MAILRRLFGPLFWLAAALWTKYQNYAAEFARSILWDRGVRAISPAIDFLIIAAIGWLPSLGLLLLGGWIFWITSPEEHKTRFSKLTRGHPVPALAAMLVSLLVIVIYLTPNENEHNQTSIENKKPIATQENDNSPSCFNETTATEQEKRRAGELTSTDQKLGTKVGCLKFVYAAARASYDNKTVVWISDPSTTYFIDDAKGTWEQWK